MAGTITAVTRKAPSKRGLVSCVIDVSVTTSMAATTIGSFYGRLVRVLIDPVAGAGSTLTSTTDILLTDHDTGAPVLSDLSAGAAAGAYRPTEAVTDNAGAAITPATTANDVNRDIFVAGALDLALANAGSAETGRIKLVFEEAV
jgi:hypothetical protein